MRSSVLSLLVVVVVAGCASTNPVLEKRVLEWHAKSSTQMFDGKGLFQKPMAPAVGQYTVYRMTNGEDRSVLRNAIVGKEGNGWIIESQTINGKNEAITQMLIAGLEKTWETLDPDHLDIVWVKIKQDDGEVQKLDGPVLSITRGTYKKLLNGLYLRFNKDEGMAAVKVPAGTFNNCTKAITEFDFLLWSDTVEAFYHPSVPMNGIVRSVSTDGDNLMELVEFGTSGARPSI